MANKAAKAPAKQQASPAKTAYLILYNFVSAVAWSVVLGRTLSVNALRGPQFTHIVVGDWTKWTQTLAGLEVLHSLLGMERSHISPPPPLAFGRRLRLANDSIPFAGVVRAPLFTTLMQVASRFLLVWAVVHPFPFLAQSPFYSSMLVAWSVTEVIRYSYFAFNLSGLQPRILTWLRYNTFYILYPIGILSECALIWKATGPAARVHEFAPWILYAILAIYVPGKSAPTYIDSSPSSFVA
ncbi:putative very-long-chain (3R)-3-hydroxyacyl-CoA dehydratase [Paramyrothecium foliicola]|nr:putative very-long-chain (3R)-3-hydroxyacyl-CoA dehydratase [Paramyrothecium foliicola]